MKINNSHYKLKNPEPIDVIISWNLNFCEGNVIKYISRWKEKNGIEDLYKAKSYIEYLIKSVESKNKDTKQFSLPFMESDNET